ncbi:MAG TPA: helix-turn-helix domain-containing protein [Spirochaetota bacterium]|mgnify:CR=1 FL=1|nr:helix-turn-helix domain-containing protein [Spirochaetota bacterium]
MEFLINFLMYFGFLFTVIIGLGQIFQKQKKEKINYLLFLSFWGQGLFILMVSLYTSGLYPHLYWMIILLIPVSYLFTPLLIMRYIWLLSFRYTLKKIYLFMFVPAIASMIYCIYGLLPAADAGGPGYIRPLVLMGPEFIMLPMYWKGIYFMMSGAKIYLFSSIALMLIGYYSFWKKGRPFENISVLRAGYFFALLMCVNTCISFVGDFISILLVKINMIIGNGFIVSMYIVSQRHTDYNRMVKIVIHKAKYAQSHIRGVDIESVKNRLYEIMELEKAFADEDISLARVADELGVTTHQLSQILNEKINKNFNTFVNEYRIKEAMQLLVEEPERSILSTGVAVGFNSYVTFCTTFSRMAGMSPSQYRRKYSK